MVSSTLAWQLPLTIATLYLLTAYTSRFLYPTLRNARVLFLIAHPDDEAMFFSPTLQHLTRRENNNLVLVLCLSSGDADGLGSVRKGELTKSAMRLGVTHRDHVVVVEDSRLPDSMTADWDPKLVAELLGRYFAPAMEKTPKDKAPKADIDAIVTFDEGGVSGHPNHKALFHGAKVFVKQLMRRHRGWESPVKVYALRTTGVVRKYAALLDGMVTIVTCLWRGKEGGKFPTPLVVVSGAGEVRAGQAAMTKAHQSQMRWFRWGWIGLSRYMYVNDFDKVKVV